MTLDELLDRFEAEHLARNGIGAQRTREVRTWLRRLAASCNGHDLTEVTPSDLLAFQGAEAQRGLSASTLSKQQYGFHGFWSWARTVGLMDGGQVARLLALAHPTFTEPPPRPYKRHEIELLRERLAAKWPLASEAAIRRYFRKQRPRAYERYIRKHARRLQTEAQISLALEEGLRRIEILRLTVAQAAPDTDVVVVPTAKKRGIYLREVPYTPHSRQCVQEWLDFRRALAPAHEGAWLYLKPDSRLEPMTMKQMERVLHQVGGGDWKWHRFRHTFATERLRAGMPLEKLQIMMGHANLRETLGYTQIVNADVRAEAARTDEAFARALGLTP